MEQKYVNAEMFGPFWEHIMPVIGGRNDTIAVYGTAFLVAPKIAITAAHVIEDYAKMCGIDSKDVYRTQDLDIYMYLLSPDIKKVRKGAEHFLFSKEDVKKYAVEHFIALKDPDIAIVYLKGEDWPANYPVLDARPPRVGQNVFSIGFPLSEANNIDSGIVSLGSDPKITSGRVIETFAESMSEYARPFPTSQVHFRAEGGMSGAPVFAVGESGVGKIIGLVSSSQSTPDNFGNYQTMVSLISSLMTDVALVEYLISYSLGIENFEDYALIEGKLIYSGPDPDITSSLGKIDK